MSAAFAIVDFIIRYVRVTSGSTRYQDFMTSLNFGSSDFGIPLSRSFFASR